MAVLFVLTTFIFSLPIICHSQTVDCRGSTCTCPPTADDTCTLQCDNTDICKGSSLNCRLDDPCIIECSAKTSCSAGTQINAGTAEDVTIICGAEDACKDNIRITCGIGHCKLYCDHSKACIDWGFIDVSYALSFQCIGYCPTNIPPQFGILPSYSPTKKPTNRPISNNNKPSALNYPTNSPFTYFLVQPTLSPGINNGEDDTDKDLSETLPFTEATFDMIMWGAISLGVCMACILFLCFYQRLCKKRRKSIREARNRGTISTSESNNLIEINKSIEYENNQELNHMMNSVDMHMANIKDVKENSINSNANSVNQSESGTDCIGNTSAGEANINEMNDTPSGGEANINDDDKSAEGNINNDANNDANNDNDTDDNDKDDKEDNENENDGMN